MPADESRPVIVIEGGGSRTWAAVLGGRPAQAACESTNPISAPADVVRERLATLVRQVLADSGVPAEMVGLVLVAHGAASTVTATEHFTDLAENALHSIGVRARLLVTNDMFPIVAAPEADVVAAAIVGTGTGFAARQKFGQWARASAADYILSDEGGGFDVGQSGLRAAIRAMDGRGRKTSLVDRAGHWTGNPRAQRLREALFDHTYTSHPRTRVAAFARDVVEAAAEGDEVATEIVHRATGEIVLGLRAVCQRLGIDEQTPLIVVSGTLALANTPYRTSLLGRLARQFPGASILDHQPHDLALAAARTIATLLGPEAQLASIRTVFAVSMRASTAQ